MNLVNYSDNDSDNESEPAKQQQQETKLPTQTQADNTPLETPQPAKKKRCAGVLSIMQSIANGSADVVLPDNLKSIPHKKQKKEEPKQEEKQGQEDEDNNNNNDIQDNLRLSKDLIVKREGYEINDLSRIRNIPHMDGQFACYIYIDITTGLSSIVKAQKNFKERVIREYPNYKFEEIEPENFHVSLSKTFYLNRHQIEPFMTSLTEKYLKGFSTMNLNIDLNRLKVFSNEDRNRFFIAASVGQGKNVVREIVDGIDNCFQAYGLDTFFKGNKHHVSLLWTTNKGCQSSEFKLYVKDNRFNSAGSDGQVTFEVKDLQIKIGNRVTSIPLQPFYAPKV